MRRSVACLLALLLGCVPPSHSLPATSDNEVRGLFETGYESRHFIACGDADRIRRPVEFVPGAAPAQWPEGVPGSYNSRVYFVRWQGAVAPRERVPIGSRTDLPPFVVSHVSAVRAPRRGECGWQPSRP